MAHEVCSYDYVNRPYAAVRAALLAEPIALFQRATRAGAEASAALHVNVAGLEVGREVTIRLVDAADTVVYGRTATRLTIEWQAAQQPGWFPSMTGTLSLYPLSATETQLELEAHYVPPLGVLGATVDSVIGHRIARASINGFVREVAIYLRSL